MPMAVLVFLMAVLGIGMSESVKAEDSVEILASTPMSGTVDIKYTNGTVTKSDVYWTGSIPTRIRVVTDSKYQSCFSLKFPITPTLTYDEISNYSTELSIWFELWTTAGEKVAEDIVSGSDWNPIGGQTMHSWTECGDWQKTGSYNLIIRTEKTLATNGLLSRIQKGSQTTPLTIEPQTVPTTTTTSTTTTVPIRTQTTTTSATVVATPSYWKVRCQKGKVRKLFIRSTKSCPKGWSRRSSVFVSTQTPPMTTIAAAAVATSSTFVNVGGNYPAATTTTVFVSPTTFSPVTITAPTTTITAPTTTIP